MLWKLLLAHVLTDFVLQTKHIAENKLSFKSNFIHCSILFVLSVIFLIDILDFSIFSMLLIISVLHGTIDYLKARLEKNKPNFKWYYFSIDQAFHILIIFLVISVFKNELWLIYQIKINSIIQSENWFKILFFLFLISFGGSYFTASVCKRFEPKNKNDNSLENAGEYIGILERIIVSSAIIIGRYEIIGFLIAAKSIIRHQEANKDQAFAEYFLVGTLTSFIWAAGFTFLFLKI